MENKLVGELQKFTRRLYYHHEDRRRYMKKWNIMKKKRLWGEKIAPDFNRFHYLIWNYTLSRIKQNVDKKISRSEFLPREFELLIYLVHKNRGVTTQDILEFPLGYNSMGAYRQMKRFKEFGIVERFEGHGSTHHRGRVYKITKEARAWISDMDSMQLGFKKMPVFSSLCTDKPPKEGLQRKKGIPNWYRAVIEFNKWVDETINEYKSISI